MNKNPRRMSIEEQRITVMEEVWEAFKEAKNILVVSPTPYDVDSIYSCLLLNQLFSHYGMGIPRPHQFFCAQKPNAQDNTLLQFAGKKLELFSTSMPTAYIMPLYIVGVDYGNFSTLNITPRDLPYHYFIGLDHHSEPAPDFPENSFQLVNPEAPSTTALIYELLCHQGFPINRKMATHVALGIMADTGRLTNSKTNADALSIMADCIKKGIPWEEIQKAAAPKMTLQRLDVWMRAKEELNFLTDRVVSLVVYRRTLAEWTETRKDIETFFGTVMCSLEDVDLAILIFEQNDGTWKISFRSNKPKVVSAAEFAKKFDGGGHHHAAAAIYQGDPFDAERMILKQLNTLC